MKYTSGIALLGAKISDRKGPVKVEIGALSGVFETTPYFVDHLKKIVVEPKKNKEGIFCLELNIENKEKKEKVIRAEDFQKDKDIEIKNPDHYLATLATVSSDQENPKLEVKLYFQKGWGYHEVKDKKQEEEIKEMIKKYFPKDEDIIVFDFDYSPVEQVSFEEKKVTVSSTKEEEELTITITTSGTVKPKDALQEVLELSKDSFNFISNSLNNNKEKKKIVKEEVKI